jgi:hypothetical protein
MSAGNWGNFSSRQVGTEVLIASKVRDDSLALQSHGVALPSLAFPLPPAGRFVR